MSPKSVYLDCKDVTQRSDKPLISMKADPKVVIGSKKDVTVMNAVEIEQAISELAEQPSERAEKRILHDLPEGFSNSIEPKFGLSRVAAFVLSPSG